MENNSIPCIHISDVRGLTKGGFQRYQRIVDNGGNLIPSGVSRTINQFIPSQEELMLREHARIVDRSKFTTFDEDRYLQIVEIKKSESDLNAYEYITPKRPKKTNSSAIIVTTVVSLIILIIAILANI